MNSGAWRTGKLIRESDGSDGGILVMFSPGSFNQFLDSKTQGISCTINRTR